MLLVQTDREREKQYEHSLCEPQKVDSMQIHPQLGTDTEHINSIQRKRRGFLQRNVCNLPKNLLMQRFDREKSQKRLSHANM